MSESKKPSALILTIGLSGDQGGDILDALQLDINDAQPDSLVLLASRQSMANAQRLCERTSREGRQCRIVELAAANDIDDIFRTTNQIIQDLVDAGYEPGQIAINYTSGTKVMGAGAVLSAVFKNIMELRYITGVTALREGEIDPGRHRIVTTRPGAVLAYQRMLNARNMLQSLLFRSAQTMLDHIDAEFLSPRDQMLRIDLQTLTRAYGEWDNFYPDLFLEAYQTVSFEDASLEVFRLQPGQWEVIEKLNEEISTNQQGENIIVDLYNNGTRRLGLGRTEDAMARLYRALEMLAQWVLQRDFQIDTNDVDTRRIPPRDRVTYEAQRSIEDGMVKIGMRKAYELLMILDAPIGKYFKANPIMKHFLEQRAESMLAHGLRPISREEAQQFMEHSREMFQIEIKEFEQISRALQFPWICEHPTSNGRVAEG